MKTPRGVVFTIIGALLLVMWLGPVVLTATLRRSHTFDPEVTLTYGPAVLLALCIMNVLSRIGYGALYFTPAEIDFLFPAPVSRLQLLLYKMVGIVAASAGVSVFFAVFLAGTSRSLPAGMIGAFLAMLFVNLVSVAGAMVKERFVRPGTTVLRSVVIVLGLAVLALIAGAWSTVAPGEGFWEAARAVLDVPAVRVLLAPLRVFVLVVTAEGLSPFAGWALLALFLNVGVFLLIVRLDALNLETALHTSRQQHDRIRRATRGGATTAWKGAAKWRIPPLPSFGGAGAIVWRQMTAALRTSRTLFVVLALIIATIAAIAFLIDAEHQHAAALAPPAVFFTFFLITMTRFDFRGDLDQLEWLKMLPISRRTLVVGQLLTPVLVLTAVQWIILAVLASAFGYAQIMLITAAFFAPLNIVLVGIENALFLTYPTRQLAVGFGDLQAMGRNMVLFLVRIGALVLWGGVAAGFGAVAMFIAGGSLAAFLVTMWVVMAATSLAVIPVTSEAFRRFDVSVHMPA